MKKFLKNTKKFTIPITIISFAIMGLLIFTFTKLNKNIKLKDEKNIALKMLNLKKSELEKAIYSRIFQTRSISSYISSNPDITTEQYQQMVNEIINRDSVINSMSLAPDGIISTIYPLQNHEEAIGLNLLIHPERKEIVQKTIETRKTFVAGPVNLVEGGVAFISYTPIFFKSNKDDTSKFWGITDIVIYKDKLFNEINLIKNDGIFNFALRGTDGKGKDGAVFWGDSSIFTKNPIILDISLPYGTWNFAAVPLKGWKNTAGSNIQELIFLFACALVISILIGLLTDAVLKIRNNELQLKALFGSMEDLIIEFNSEGRYMKIAPTNEKLLIRPPHELLGRTVYEFFDKEKADFFHEAINRCLRTKELVVIEYEIEINSKMYWFEARISYISSNAVIYVAHDNTQSKKVEEELKDYARKVTEINNTKDKFFSIIAHDLKSPFAGFLGLTKMMADELETFSPEEMRYNSHLLRESADNLYKLLENLLEWSKVQRGQINFNPENVDLSLAVILNIAIVEHLAVQKDITIINNVGENEYVYADLQLLNAVIRNFLSNAIKFSPRGGKIEIFTQNEVSENKYKVVCVKDYGIGISKENQEFLFRIDKKVSQLGTEGEPSTGLGLLLCKEFIDIHKGKIWVESTLGEGSTFCFSLPAEN